MAQGMQLDPYKLSEVKVTGKEFGHGSYATVWELEYMGLKCAGKKVHHVLVQREVKSYTVRRFEEECRLLSKVRHPNIVQFLGVYVQEENELPILVMEHLPFTLTSCIEKHGVLPKEISYSILYDTALGLRYLHSQTPPIIHRDLSSNNILLTHSLIAKISDLGVAKIANMSPLQVSHMTQTPGTPAFMPPEVMVANPKYDKSVDVFSYGIMTIHVLSGAWPDPQTGPTYKQHGTLRPNSEAKRREIFLKQIGNDHPLMNLILNCVDNDPEERMNTIEITERLSKMVSEHPQRFQSALEMQLYIDSKEEDIKALKTVGDERAEVIRNKEEELRRLKEEASEKLETINRENERLRAAKTLEAIDLQLRNEDLEGRLRKVTVTQREVLKENNSLMTKLNEQSERKEERDRKVRQSLEQSLREMATAFEATLSEERKISQSLSEEVREKEKERQQIQEAMSERIRTLASENAAYQASLSMEKETSLRLSQEIKEKEMEKQTLQESTAKEVRKLTDEQTQIQLLAARVSMECERLKANNHTMVEQLEVMEAKMNRYSKEMNEKEISLQQNAFVTSRASEQLTAVQKFLSTTKQPMQVSISWEACADLPFATAAGQSTVINDKVYFGGGVMGDDSHRYLVFCYSTSQNQWITLPPLSVKYFGLGQFRGRLVVAGGVKASGRRKSNVYMLDSQKWKNNAIPSMITSRTFPGVISLREVLVVAGGNNEQGEGIDTVEVLRYSTMQWQMVASLPTPSCNISLVSKEDTIFALGGYNQPLKLNQALNISFGDLTNEEHEEDPRWRVLQLTTTYQPAAAVLCGKVIAVGGWTGAQGEAASKSIYVYSSTTDSWLYFSDLPEPRAWSTCAVLSSTEILVVGGQNQDKVKTVYKGTLTLDT